MKEVALEIEPRTNENIKIFNSRVVILLNFVISGFLKNPTFPKSMTVKFAVYP